MSRLRQRKVPIFVGLNLSKKKGKLPNTIYSTIQLSTEQSLHITDKVDALYLLQ